MMPEDAIDTEIVQKVLPLSGVQLQWRSADRCFRVRHGVPAGEIVTEACEDELLWRRWSGRSDMAVGVSGQISGSTAQWWVVWGEYAGDTVTVMLADGTAPEVSLVGGLWVSEWSGPERGTAVTTATSRTEVRFAPPSFLPPPLVADGAAHHNDLDEGHCAEDLLGRRRTGFRRVLPSR